MDEAALEKRRALNTAAASTPNVTAVAHFFGIAADGVNAVLERTLRAALTHDSYRHEHPDPQVTTGVLRALESVGVTWFNREVAVRLYLSRKFDAVGRLSSLHATVLTAFTDWLPSLDWMVTAVGWGGSQAAVDPSKQTRRKIAHQVIGALVLSQEYSALRNGFRPFFERALVLDPPNWDFDPHQFLTRIIPSEKQKWTETAAGPQHQRTFSAELRTPGNRSALAHGATRKAAKMAAARTYIEQYLDPAAQRSPREPFAMPKIMTVPDVTRRSVDLVRTEFALQPRWEPLILQALIHSSWTYENASKVEAARQADNSLLAFVGSHAIDHEYALSVGSGALQTRPDDLEVLTAPNDEVAPLASVLGLDGAMLLGRGEMSNRSRRNSRSSNVVQATVAAVWISAHTPPALVDLLPARWSPFRAVIAPPQLRRRDDKTLLEQMASVTGLEVSYEMTSTGPEQEKSFRAVVTVVSPPLDSRATFQGVAAPSAKTAKQRAATLVVEVFESLSESLIDVPPAPGKGTALVLEHLLAVAQSQPSVALRWRKHGLLGTGISKPATLIQWARAADTTVRGFGITSTDSLALSEFFRNGAVERSPQHIAAEALGEMVRRLQRITQPSAIPPDLDTDLATLSAVYRAAGNDSAPTDIEETIADWKLLYRRSVGVSGVPPPDELSGGERAMLDELLKMILQQHGPVEVRLTPGSLLIEPASGPVDIGFAKTVALFENLTTRLEARLTANGLLIEFLGSMPDAGRPIMRAVLDCLAPDPTALDSSIANTLHDMKNQLDASRQQSAGVSKDLGRTAQLKRELIASEHLDAAKTLARQLEAAGAFTAVIRGSTELSAYLRSYGGRLLERLPAKIHIAVQSPAQPVDVAVDETYLAAILDNLIKNSFEALPDHGGTIELIGSTEKGVAIIEVGDSGPGIPDATIASLQAGGSVRSTKLNGNGLGLVGVRDMSRRARGDLTYVGDTDGARWWIELPLLEQDATEDEG